MSSTQKITYILAGASAALFCASLFIFFIGNAQSNFAITRMREHISYMSQVFRSSSIMIYGTVESVDSTNRTMMVRIENRYDRTGQAEVLRFTVVEEALILRQHMLRTVSSEAVYGGLSAAAPENLTGIRQGERVALVSRKAEGIFSTYAILVGNPL